MDCGCGGVSFVQGCGQRSAQPEVGAGVEQQARVTSQMAQIFEFYPKLVKILRKNDSSGTHYRSAFWKSDSLATWERVAAM